VNAVDGNKLTIMFDNLLDEPGRVRLNVQNIFAGTGQKTNAESGERALNLAHDDFRGPRSTGHSFVWVVGADSPDVGLITFDSNANAISAPGQMFKILKIPSLSWETAATSGLSPR